MSQDEMMLRTEPGWVGAFTRQQAPGALPNGTRVVKVGTKDGDANPDGTPGVILGSLQHPDVNDGAPMYFVEWASRPRMAVAVAPHRIRRAAT